MAFTDHVISKHGFLTIILNFYHPHDLICRMLKHNFQEHAVMTTKILAIQSIQDTLWREGQKWQILLTPFMDAPIGF